MKTENYFAANSDLQFTFDHVIPWSELSRLAESGFKDERGAK